MPNDIAEVAVKVEGGAKNVDHALVISLLEKILAALQVALGELKSIVQAELLLNGVACTLKELAGIVAKLIIVRILFCYLWLLLNLSFWLGYHRSTVYRSGYCWFP